jgi:hypothetical protein
MVTAVGLGGLLSQASAINDKLDPFHSHRTPTYLGFWYGHQEKSSWWTVKKPPLYGTVLVANLEDGFCGKQIVHLTRLPLFTPPGKAGWAIILAIFHPEKPFSLRMTSTSIDEAEKATEYTKEKKIAATEDIPPHEKRDRRTQWKSMERMQLVRYQAHACVSVSRTSLITMLVLTNARPAFSYSDASGFRAGYASYNGQWYITWPIGQEAVVQFSSHDSHKKSTDVYPPSFAQRTDRCTQMVAGVIAAPSGMQVAFCGRKPPGTYVLEYAMKGFPGAHGSRHLYNMLGGKVYEVDYIFARSLDKSTGVNDDYLELRVPSKDSSEDITFLVPQREQEIIAQALDCLPWNHLSWSIHRGMRDILIAYSKPTMDRFRSELAALLKRTVSTKPYLLERKGWESNFVRSSMGEMAASAVLLGKGNSGDLVRVVTDIMLALVDEWGMDHLDEVHFWRLPDEEKELNMVGAVALTKVFIVEWSNEFDYQMYHDLPVNLKFA